MQYFTTIKFHNYFVLLFIYQYCALLLTLRYTALHKIVMEVFRISEENSYCDFIIDVGIIDILLNNNTKIKQIF